MKIEGSRPNIDAPPAAKVEPARVGSGGTSDHHAKVGQDAVTVSSDVALANQAIEAAQLQPAIRPDAVARGKALLASGQLGSDPQALADSLIERTLEEI